ncbi:MAG: beta-glucosidase [Gemmatimonadales bacterium]|nr:beta-glucosidase [Gemmatimonadales bacterium]MBP6570322.1 beta-glucosidase [Gemmatimonadales bacterium]
MPEPRTFQFPANFLWGAATSAYQIEGSPLADGAGASNWHRFSHTPGATELGATGDVACDHYRRAPEDVQLMRTLGLNAYRFSLSWSRVLPTGRGAVNRKGLGFYDRLVDELLANGIAPVATLYHWDLPAALDEQGGWLNRDIAPWFAEYTHVVVEALADRVAMWTTLNEPWVVMDAGYQHGVHAPGHRSLFEAPIVAHNLLRAHGAGMQAIRAAGGRHAGLVVNLEPKVCATNDPVDLAATRRADAYMNRQFLDPIYLGHYPEELAELYGEAWPDFPADDFRLIMEPTDYLGINYYTRMVMRHDPTAPAPLHAGRVHQPEHTYTTLDWEVHAPALTELLVQVRDRYGRMPCYITENGAAFYDAPVAEGDVVPDPLRTAYFRDHLRAVHDAITLGVDMRGYFAWSLLDNFEWSAGYGKRFGLYHVDFATQRRTPKASAHFYADVIRTHGGALGH